ncbi:hypothetical protein AAFF_G00191960 [Aldrovandia affinis]|uniref:Uncharacterized protein n=1 Tax=Aldrovandia affinis TaxID=143900 RepID=A0AAD7R095_9TELE|nr:hypothetical protein AAFF_G00191960 [Aldrovandia affinis]
MPEQRHPEKAHRKDNAQPKKPKWICVKAPTGDGYNATRKIMREKQADHGVPAVWPWRCVLGLNHVVITSVDRDDLEDGGAEHFAQTIRAVRHRSPKTTIEILTGLPKV